MSSETIDRYQSFSNINCDGNADRLVSMLKESLELGRGSPEWIAYFNKKLEEQDRMLFDNLRLIGNQTNPLFEYFDLCSDNEALELLSQIEMECL